MTDNTRTGLKQRFIELVCPHRRGRKKKATQDGRILRRYKRGWIGWQKRLLVRNESLIQNYRAFMHTALAMTTLRII